MSDKADLHEYLLRLGDNCLILGHRLSEWCGHGPELEEDLALANTALDLIGQAQLWLSLAAKVKGGKLDADVLAYRRDVHEFRNVLMVEQPNGDFAATMARQWYFDCWHHLLMDELQRSANTEIAAIASKSLKEVNYHLQRSNRWVVCLGDGTQESHERMQRALDELWMYTGEFFETDGIDKTMSKNSIGVDMATLAPRWMEHIEVILKEAGLKLPASTWMQSGGKNGTHGEHLGYLLAEMQFLARAYPDARW
jgi:ring-1,2-phenylacetyl-CoA epoxidase subunit PaaC